MPAEAIEFDYARRIWKSGRRSKDLANRTVDTVTMMNEEQRGELRQFLKARRARIRPGDVGLPAGSRRRVPGLRREEVATLAGIGVSWYTEFENGDAPAVSDETLFSIADALRLSASEREYLIGLTGRTQVAELPAIDPRVIATIRALSVPAYVITAGWDVVACNDAFRRVWQIGEDEEPFSVIERLFVEPEARKRHGKYFIENITPIVAMLRSSQGRQPHSQPLQNVRNLLMADDELRALWDAYEIASPLSSNTCTITTTTGDFRYQTLTLPISGNSYAIVVQIPDDESMHV